MLRVVRFGIRIRKFNFVEESYKLAGTKDEIALPEDLRNLKKYLETGEKDSSHLLKEIEKIHNPYKELGISQSASNDQIQKTINRRKNQLNHEIQKIELLKLETGEKYLSGETSGIIRIDNQLLKLKEKEQNLELIVSAIGTPSNRYNFDASYNLEVHNIIWSDFSLREKVNHKIKVKSYATASVIKDQIPPSLVNTVQTQVVQGKRQMETISLRVNNRQSRLVLSIFLYFWILVVFMGCALDMVNYDNDCWNHVTLIYGHNPDKFNLFLKYGMYGYHSFKQLWVRHFYYRYFAVDVAIRETSVVTEFEERDLSFETLISTIPKSSRELNLNSDYFSEKI